MGVTPKSSPSPKSMTKIEKLLPFVLAVLLPGLNFINNPLVTEQFNLFELIRAWMSSSLFLLILWYANNWLGGRNVDRYFWKAALLNIGLASIFILIISSMRPDHVVATPSFYWTSGLRMIFTSAIFIAVQQSLKTARTVEKLKTENLSLRSEQYKAELDQLRKQVNPHFLINTLSTLRAMIRNSNPNSENFVMNLSSFYRQILETHNENYISLKEEIEFVEAYFYLMKMRYEDALRLEITIDPKSLMHSIPFFTLQSLVENCIKHNILSMRKPLEIKIYQKNEVAVTVSNNYQPRHQTSQSEGVGLTNLLERYKLIGIEKGLEIEKTDSHFNVTVKLF
jgi:LytS/YehU family sensor histidine kinase